MATTSKVWYFGLGNLSFDTLYLVWYSLCHDVK